MLEDKDKAKYVVLISAEAEWKIVRNAYPDVQLFTSPFGEQFKTTLHGDTQTYDVTFVHGGWGKVAAAASTQYVIDYLKPELLINIGTCGGFDSSLHRGDIVLADKTLIYDIIEQMGDPDEAIVAYTTDIDNAWIEDNLPQDTQRGLLISADRDIIQSDVKGLIEKHQAIAADWESGAIAWTTSRNHTPVLILRGVSDLVSEHEAKAYGSLTHFEEGTHVVMTKLLAQLPQYLAMWDKQR